MNSTFTNNSALFGGAVRCTNGCNATFQNSFFSQNIASSGGAIQVEAGSSVTVNNLKIYNNIAMLNGGAVNVLQNGQLTANKVLFIGNQAYRGSVINLLGSMQPQSIKLTNTLFFRNQATQNTI